MGKTSRALAAVLMLAAGSAAALTPLDEGMTTRLDAGASGAVPANRVARVTAGSDFAHFVQYEGLPAGRTSLRCLLAEPDGTVQVDETELHDDFPASGYAYCAWETDERDAELGTLNMTMWINGERVGHQVLEVAEGGGGGLSLKRKIKYALGGLAFAIWALFWVKKKLGARGGREESAPAPIAIGSKIAGAAISAAATAATAAPVAEVSEVQKCARQYAALIAQADKGKALETGRQYIALLVQDREGARAFDVFKQCLAIDPKFRTARGEDVLPLAKAARAAGDPQAAVAVVRGFDKAFPGHAAIPEVFVFSAQLLAEELKNGEMARKILEHVVAKYPGHYVAGEAKRYLQGMAQPA